MSTTNFLGQLNADIRGWLMAEATHRVLRKGEFIFRVGDTEDAVYMLLSGRIKTYKIAPSGREVILWFGFPGEIFGLVETPSHRGRMVSVEACETIEVAELPLVRFRKLLETNSDVSQLCIRVIASRLGMLANRLVYLMADNAEARIAKLLLDLAARYHNQNADTEQAIGLTHQEIADITGVQRQTVTRILGRFTDTGALSVRYRKISIRNRDQLLNCAARHP